MLILNMVETVELFLAGWPKQDQRRPLEPLSLPNTYCNPKIHHIPEALCQK